LWGTTINTYTFGDTPTASDRLRLLAEVFEPVSLELLQRWAPLRPSHVVDLGCGPGHSTRLLHRATAAQRTTGVERSASYVAQARRERVTGVSYVEHDVTDVPLPVPPADLVFVRYLLTHLSEPVGALEGWASLLRAGGRMIVQETAALTSNEPALTRYYELVADLQRHHGQDLNVGSRLGQLAAAARLRVVHEALRTFRPPVPAMARLHALNMQTWREESYARATFDAGELDDLWNRLMQLAVSAPPDATIDQTLGELVVEA
jgi:ubiquinone/menaquinone biosynthesis C-methylase UbiE